MEMDDGGNACDSGTAAAREKVQREGNDEPGHVGRKRRIDEDRAGP